MLSLSLSFVKRPTQLVVIDLAKLYTSLSPVCRSVTSLRILLHLDCLYAGLLIDCVNSLIQTEFHLNFILWVSGLVVVSLITPRHLRGSSLVSDPRTISFFLSFFLDFFSISMPNTPTQKSLTGMSSSSTTKLCLLDIKTLIESTKTEILHTVKNEHAKLNDVIASLLSRMESLENKNAELEQRCKRLEETNAQLTQRKEDEVPSEEKLAFVLSECEERKQRENNLIFSGIGEETDGTVHERRTRDEEKVKNILTHLKLEDVSPLSVSRIGKTTNGKPRLLRVQMKSASLKKRALAVSKTLRSSDSYRQVYINPDYTKNEQEIQKKLREELKKLRASGEDVIIFRGKIIKRADKQVF